MGWRNDSFTVAVHAYVEAMASLCQGSSNGPYFYGIMAPAVKSVVDNWPHWEPEGQDAVSPQRGQRPAGDILSVYYGYFQQTEHPHVQWVESTSCLRDVLHLVRRPGSSVAADCEEHAALSLYVSVLCENLLLSPPCDIPSNLVVALYDTILPGLATVLPDVVAVYRGLFEPVRRALCGPVILVAPTVRPWDGGLEWAEDSETVQWPGGPRRPQPRAVRRRLSESHPTLGHGLRLLLDEGCVLPHAFRLRLAEGLLRKMDASANSLDADVCWETVARLVCRRVMQYAGPADIPLLEQCNECLRRLASRRFSSVRTESGLSGGRLDLTLPPLCL